jgi:hypothetical protein
LCMSMFKYACLYQVLFILFETHFVPKQQGNPYNDQHYF